MHSSVCYVKVTCAGVHVYYTLSTPLQQAELHEIAEITAPDSMTLSERRDARRAAEDCKFDEEYYL